MTAKKVSASLELTSLPDFCSCKNFSELYCSKVKQSNFQHSAEHSRNSSNNIFSEHKKKSKSLNNKKKKDK